MTKRDEREPESEERREFVKGGLLAVATALGFLPGCSDADSETSQSGAGASAADSGSGAAASSEAGRTAGGENPRGAAGSGERRPASSSQATTGSGSAGVSGAGNGGRAGDAAKGGQGGAAVASNAGAGTGGQPTAAGATATTGDPKDLVLPRSMLGKTGVSIPILGLGTSRLGERNRGNPTGQDYDDMVEIFAAAIDMGIEYIDTGAIYGRAEEALGEVLSQNGRRDKVFLVTKLHTDTRSQAQTMFERSLERMKTDHVDLLHLHNTGDRDLDTALGQDGSFSYILDQKAAGKTRFVGFTGHNNGPNLMRILQTDQVDAMMCLMNFVDHSTYGFSKEVREEAVRRGVGVMCMKVFGGTESPPGVGNGLANAMDSVPHPSNMQVSFDESVLPDCIRFIKSLSGVTGMVIGINHLWELSRTIQWVVETQPFDETEFNAIVAMGQMVASRWERRYG
jgi:predicted aldo/keto reductase-like oxidoreductase